jgi:hypothetical protein
MKSLLENKNLPDNIILPKEFEVRDTQPTQAVNTESNVNEEKTYSGKTISELGMSQEEWNKLTIEEKNKIKSCN